ncbi:hypothetical protein JCM11641_005918 [Rhodosporidiobolus odoratus]
MLRGGRSEKAASDADEENNVPAAQPLDTRDPVYKLAELLDKLSNTLNRAGPVAHRYLNLTSSRATEAFSVLEQSDNAVAQLIVGVANDPRWLIYRDKAIDLSLRHAPILVSLVGLVLHLFITDLARRRDARRQQQRYLASTATTEGMADFGLGTPTTATGAAARRADDYGAIEVQWGREKIRVPLPPPASPLSALKATLYNITGVPPDHQKLIFSGAVLRDDLLPLSSYQLVDDESADFSANDGDKPRSFWDSWSFAGRSGSKKKLKKLVMLGSKDVSARVDDRLSTRKDLQDLAAAETAAPSSSSEAKVDDEATVQRRIKEIAEDRLTDLEPKVGQVEAYIQQVQKKRRGEAVEEEELSAPQSRTLLFLSETLLQALLRLDSIEVPGSFAQARADRKEAVKRVQSVLDRVDAAKEAVKGLEKA